MTKVAIKSGDITPIGGISLLFSEDPRILPIKGNQLSIPYTLTSLSKKCVHTALKRKLPIGQ